MDKALTIIAESATLTDAESASSAHCNDKQVDEDTFQDNKQDQIQLVQLPDGLLPRIQIQFSDQTLKEKRDLKHMDKPVSSQTFVRNQTELPKWRSLFQFNHQERIAIIYLYKVHQMKVKHITELLGLKYSSVMSIVKYYKDEGRINKLLTPNSKNLILYFRRVNLEIQKQYRVHRKATQIKEKKIFKKKNYRWISQKEAKEHSKLVEQQEHENRSQRMATCPLQMIFHEQEGLKLIARSLNQTNSSDELDSKTFNLRIFNEVNFTDSAQAVEKNEFDFTKDLDIRDNSDNQLESCFLFKGALSNINNVFDKKVWSRSTEDFLSLPQP